MKNKIHVLFLLILLLQLLTEASFAAEKINIAQLREQLPERWVQEYQTYGRTIVVDVRPIAPTVGTISILRVVQDTSVPEISELSSDWNSKVSDDGIFNIQLGDPCAAENKTKGTYKSVNYYPPFDFDKAYAQNNALTLSEVIGYIEKIMNDVNYGQWGFKKPCRLLTNIMTESKAKGAVFQGSYYLSFLQQLDGIPILNHARFGIEEPKGDPPFIRAQLFCVLQTLNDISMGGYKVKVDEVLADDVPLCNFSEVQKSIEQEILAGHIRRIFDVELGYVLYNQPGGTGKDFQGFNMSYYAVPMWVVNCYYVSTPHTELRDYSQWDVPERGVIEYKQMYINAQTGKTIDRGDNHVGAADYTGFLAWDDVGGKP